jgi:predicted MFS family arabinose efflux permease
VTAPLKIAPLPTHSRRVLLAFAAAVFVANLDARVVAPLLPTIGRELGASMGQVGRLVSWYLVPYGVFQLVHGPLADRFGRLRVAAWALLVFSVGTALCGARVSLGTMVAFRVLTGAAAAALFPLGLAYIGDTVPYRERQAAISALMASAGAAQAFSTSAGGFIAELVSWRAVFPLIAALGGLLCVALFVLRGHEAPVRDHRRPPVGELLRAPGLLRLLALVAVEGLLFNGIPFLGGLLDARFGLTPLLTGLLMSLGGVAQLAMARTLPWLLRTVNPRALLIGGGGALGAGFLLAAFAPTPGFVGVGALLMGAGFSACHTNLQARATESFPRARGTAIALFAFSLSLGGGVGAGLYADGIDRYGYAPALAVGGLGLLVFTAVAASRFGLYHAAGLEPAVSKGGAPA